MQLRFVLFTLVGAFANGALPFLESITGGDVGLAPILPIPIALRCQWGRHPAYFGLRSRLYGGGKRIKKLTPEQQAFVDKIDFPPEMAKDLRRHWKKKPEILEVKQNGKIIKVRTSWALQRIKEKALDMQKHMQTLPMRLIDLGTKGLRWIRAIAGQEIKLPEDEPEDNREVSKEEAATISVVQQAFAQVDGYAIAKVAWPKVQPRPQHQQLMPPQSADPKALPAAPSATAVAAAPATAKALSTAKGSDAGGRAVAAAPAPPAVPRVPAEALPHLGSHTYGEIDARAFADVLALVRPQPGETFVDLGSGTGKAVMLAAALYPLGRAYGIEVALHLHRAGQTLLDQFKSNILPTLPLYRNGRHTPPTVELVLGDALEAAEWEEARVVYAACTCWSPEAMDRLARGCQRLPVGARVIVATRRPDLPAASFRLLDRRLRRYGRGRVTFFAYEKIA